MFDINQPQPDTVKGRELALPHDAGSPQQDGDRHHHHHKRHHYRVVKVTSKTNERDADAHDYDHDHDHDHARDVDNRSASSSESSESGGRRRRVIYRRHHHHHHKRHQKNEKRRTVGGNRDDNDNDNDSNSNSNDEETVRRRRESLRTLLKQRKTYSASSRSAASHSVAKSITEAGEHHNRHGYRQPYYNQETVFAMNEYEVSLCKKGNDEFEYSAASTAVDARFPH